MKIFIKVVKEMYKELVFLQNKNKRNTKLSQMKSKCHFKIFCWSRCFHVHNVFVSVDFVNTKKTLVEKLKLSFKDKVKEWFRFGEELFKVTNKLILKRHKKEA